MGDAEPQVEGQPAYDWTIIPHDEATCCSGCRILLEHVATRAQELGDAISLMTSELSVKGIGGILRDALTGGKKVKRGRGNRDEG